MAVCGNGFLSEIRMFSFYQNLRPNSCLKCPRPLLRSTNISALVNHLVLFTS